MNNEFNVVTSMIDANDVSFKSAMFTIAVAAMCSTGGSRQLLINTHKHLLTDTIGGAIQYIDMDDFKPLVTGEYRSSDIDHDEYPSQTFFWYNGKCFADIQCTDELSNINSWSFI